MYRRNIAPLLYKIAFVVGLIVLYGAWLKPTYLQKPLPTAPQTPAPQTEKPLADAHPDEPPEPAPQQTRLIDQSAVPETKHQEQLVAIREDLEKGNLPAVERRLADLPSALQSDSHIRPYLAILWNNLGIEQEKVGGTQSSVKTFKKAVSLDPKNPVIQLNLAHAYWELRDPAMTVDFLERLIALAPNEPFPHLAMADLLQERDRLSEAATHLDQASERAAKDPGMQSYLRTVTAKVRRTEAVESRMSSRDSAHFTVKFDGDADHSTWTAVQDILEDAYREIGQKLNHYPSKPIVVVLHTKETFQGATDSPSWADGLFDPVLGRIQIPSQGATTDREWLTRVLRHEFAHALIHDLLGLGGTTIPTWLNEGLAMQLSGDRWNELQPARNQEIPIVPLPALEAGWGGFNHETAAVAYLEAHSATRYMIDRFGMHRIQQLLGHLKAKQSLTASMQSELSLSYEQFQSRWMDHFEQELKKG